MAASGRKLELAKEDDCNTLMVKAYSVGEERVRLARAWLDRHGGVRTVAGWIVKPTRSLSWRLCTVSGWSLRTALLLFSIVFSVFLSVNIVWNLSVRRRMQDLVMAGVAVGVPLSSPEGLGLDSNRTDVYLLMFIKSAPTNFLRREEVRRSYGWMLRLRNESSSCTQLASRSVCHFFVIGRTEDSEVDQRAEKEAILRRDVVLGEFYDHYTTLTTKLLFTMDWALTTYNFAFMLIGDDDTFINPRALVRWLAGSRALSTGLYAGAVTPYTLVIRDPKNKRWGQWSVPRSVYAPKNYPSFVLGTAYIMSYDVVRDALVVAVSERQTLFGVEDAYFGILMHNMGVKAQQAKNFIHCAVSNCTIEDPIMVGPLEMPMLRDFGLRLRSREAICNDTVPLCGYPPIYD